MDNDSDLEGVMLALEPEQQQVQNPSLISFVPVSQTRSTESQNPGTPPSVLGHEQENGPSNSVNVVSGGSDRVQRWPKRSTAGCHTNPFHLPQSVNQIISTPVRTLQVSQVVNNQVVQEVFRPWL